MNWFAKFEKKFSKYAIKNLMFYIIVLYAIGFVMNTFFLMDYMTHIFHLILL